MWDEDVEKGDDEDLRRPKGLGTSADAAYARLAPFLHKAPPSPSQKSKPAAPGVVRVVSDLKASADNQSPRAGGRTSLSHLDFEKSETPKRTDSGPLPTTMEEVIEKKISLTPRPDPAASRAERFRAILASENVDVDLLRRLGWKGVPDGQRAETWKILLGYQTPSIEGRDSTRARKRKDYLNAVEKYFGEARVRTEDDDATQAQILKDLPRMAPDCPVFHQPQTQKALERILFVWAVRHPASGYVQGINDLLVPFFIVFLAEEASVSLEAAASLDVSGLELGGVEADSYWCLTHLLDGIQDHYTFSQPGIQRMVYQLQELVQRVDEKLAKHLASENAQFIQFAFRWMNCLLVREFPVPLIVRLWDTYFCEGADRGFNTFHIYVCAAILTTFSAEICTKEFQDIVLFLQTLPTATWDYERLEVIVAQAYLWSSTFQETQGHLRK